MLRCNLYAGYLEYENWAVPLTKAKHPPLISYDTYLTIQERLEGKNVVPARKNLSRDIPLRSFLVCEHCGRRITSCWSQCHTGRKYPYYLCQYRNCPERGKSTPKQKVENEFEQLLRKVVPDQTPLNVAEQMFRDAWEVRIRSTQSELFSLRTQSQEIEKMVELNLNRAVRIEADATAGAYEARV